MEPIKHREINNNDLKELIDNVDRNLKSGNTEKLSALKEKVRNFKIDIDFNVSHYNEKVEKHINKASPSKEKIGSNRNKLVDQKRTQSLVDNKLKEIEEKLTSIPTQQGTQVQKTGSSSHKSKSSEILNNKVDRLVHRASNCAKEDCPKLKEDIQLAIKEVTEKESHYIEKPKSDGETLRKQTKQHSNLEKLNSALMALTEVYDPSLFKETFLNTSGSARFSNYNGKNVGAHILGFFEAIGRAVLTPFVAIYLSFASGNHDFTSTMKSYFDTIKQSITLLR